MSLFIFVLVGLFVVLVLGLAFIHSVWKIPLIGPIIIIAAVFLIIGSCIKHKSNASLSQNIPAEKVIDNGG